MNELIQTLAPESVPLDMEVFSRSDLTTVVWLAGAGFLINARGTVILVDPLLTMMPGKDHVCETGMGMRVDYPIAAADIPRVDVVLYTHSDDDHLGPETAKILMKLNPVFIGPPPVFEQLVKLGADPNAIRIFRREEVARFGTATVEFVPADHPWQLLDPVRFGRPFRAGDCCGFVIDTPDARCYFPGDTRLMEEHLTLRDIDVLALDSSVCTYHLNHFNAVSLINALNHALLIPYHYGTYDVPDSTAQNGDPMDIIGHVADGAARLRNLAPGACLQFREKREVRISRAR